MTPYVAGHDVQRLGRTRDAFGELLPATSAIPARARYLPFIPRWYAELEEGCDRSTEIAGEAVRDEVARIASLVAVSKGQGPGLIGYEAWKSLRRLPSSDFWLGRGCSRQVPPRERS